MAELSTHIVSDHEDHHMFGIGIFFTFRIHFLPGG